MLGRATMMAMRACTLGLALTLAIALSGCPESHGPASCTSSRECSPSGQLCDPSSGTCVECLTTTDCLSADLVCTAHRCQPITHCVSTRECPGLVCDPALGYCVECVTDVDCPGGGQICASSHCVAIGLDAGPGPVDAGPPDAFVERTDAWVQPPPFLGEVDLLVMIDNSNSMSEEQASLVSQLPRVVQILTTGDRDGNGVPEFTPASSLHIGIVTSDMGLGDVTGIATCDPGFGDDGLLQIRSRHGGTGCMADYSGTYAGNVFTFEAGGTRSAAQLATDVGCVANIGTDGCGFEFELEAPLKALSLVPTATGDSPVSWTHPGYRPPTFYAGTFGHGDDPGSNGGFLRPGSILAILTVNDEDDCSTQNYHVFSPDDPSYNVDARGNPVNLNMRCHTWPDQILPVQRYVDGFVGLRADPTRLVYAAITGVPPAVAGMDPAVILADPAMVERLDPSSPDRLLPACVSPDGRGVAYPAIRMTQLAQRLQAAGAITTVQSICTGDFGGAMDEIMGALQFALDHGH